MRLLRLILEVKGAIFKKMIPLTLFSEIKVMEAFFAKTIYLLLKVIFCDVPCVNEYDYVVYVMINLFM